MLSTVIILLVLSFIIPYAVAKVVLYLSSTRKEERVLWFEKDGKGTPRMSKGEYNG